MIDRDTEIDNRLVMESMVFADHKFLQKLMPEFVLTFDCPACSITIHASFSQIKLVRTDDYYYMCICKNEYDNEDVSKVMKKLKKVFDLELFKEDEILNSWCSNYAWKRKELDKSHIHYHYRLTYNHGRLIYKTQEKI